MAKENIGEFEEVVLTLVCMLREDAYGAAIADECNRRLRRNISLSAVHVTLYRLEDKGLISSAMSGATHKRGGRRKRVYTISHAGLAMLKQMQEVRMDLWRLIPELKIK
ncbi:MAG: PadR family transcriptional regulator [Bacteroidota bacterium]